MGVPRHRGKPSDGPAPIEDMQVPMAAITAPMQGEWSYTTRGCEQPENPGLSLTVSSGM